MHSMLLGLEVIHLQKKLWMCHCDAVYHLIIDKLLELGK